MLPYPYPLQKAFEECCAILESFKPISPDFLHDCKKIVIFPAGNRYHFQKTVDSMGQHYPHVEIFIPKTIENWTDLKSLAYPTRITWIDLPDKPSLSDWNLFLQTFPVETIDAWIGLWRSTHGMHDAYLWDLFNLFDTEKQLYIIDVDEKWRSFSKDQQNLHRHTIKQMMYLIQQHWDALPDWSYNPPSSAI